MEQFTEILYKHTADLHSAYKYQLSLQIMF